MAERILMNEYKSLVKEDWVHIDVGLELYSKKKTAPC